MNIEEERKAFEGYVLSLSKYKKRSPKFIFDLDENGDYDNQDIYELHHAWQASANREGFVLVKASDHDRKVCQLIDERDHAQEQAEQLKDKLQDLYGVDFGEHSNCNCPFQNAIYFDDSALVLVPKEPTVEICKQLSSNLDNAKLIYKAMLSAQEQSNESN